MSQHSTLSPSKAHRWADCPGSVQKCAALPVSVEVRSEAADDGTHTHWLLEQFLTDPNFVPLPGETYISKAGSFILRDDRIERLDFCIDYIRERRAKLGDCRVVPEQTIDSTVVFCRGDMGGTADVQIISKDELEIIDLKDGMSPVGAENNYQMIIYALLMVGTLPRHEDPENQKIKLTILQPKLRLIGQSGIDTWEMTGEELLAYLPKLRYAAALTETENPPIVPGETQCKYCPAKGDCLTLVEHSLAESGISFGAVDLPQEVVDVVAVELTDDKLRSLIMAIPLIQTMIEAAEEEALRRFKIGQPIDGLKVVRGRGSRSWNCPPDGVADKLKRMGVPKDHVFKTSVVTPAQAEKLKWKKQNGEEKSLTDRQKVTLNGLIDKKEGKLRVVSIEADGKPETLMIETFKPVMEIPEWMR